MMLIFTTLQSALLLTMLAPELQSVDEAKAIAAIKALGGKYSIDEKADGKPVIEVEFSFEKLSDDNDLALLKDLPNLKSLKLSFSRISDNALAHLKSVPRLQTLQLFKTGITADGLKH